MVPQVLLVACVYKHCHLGFVLVFYTKAVKF